MSHSRTKNIKLYREVTVRSIHNADKQSQFCEFLEGDISVPKHKQNYCFPAWFSIVNGTA